MLHHERRTPTAEDPREHAVRIGAPDRVDDFGRRLHKVSGDALAFNDGLDRSLARAGLVPHNTIPWGPDGGEVWYAEGPGPAGTRVPVTEVSDGPNGDRSGDRGGDGQPGAGRGGRGVQRRAGPAADGADGPRRGGG